MSKEKIKIEIPIKALKYGLHECVVRHFFTLRETVMIFIYKPLYRLCHGRR